MSSEDDACPARPAWDKALSEAYGDTTRALMSEVEALIRGRLAEFAGRFMAEHPEAVLRQPEAAAA